MGKELDNSKSSGCILQNCVEICCIQFNGIILRITIFTIIVQFPKDRTTWSQWSGQSHSPRKHAQNQTQIYIQPRHGNEYVTTQKEGERTLALNDFPAIIGFSGLLGNLEERWGFLKCFERKMDLSVWLYVIVFDFFEQLLKLFW